MIPEHPQSLAKITRYIIVAHPLSLNFIRHSLVRAGSLICCLSPVLVREEPPLFFLFSLFVREHNEVVKLVHFLLNRLFDRIHEAAI